MRKIHQIGSGRRGRLFGSFCLLFFLLGVLVWVELYSRIPDHLIAAADQKQEKLLSGQLPGWVKEEIEETVEAEAGQTSDIPEGSVKLTADEEVSGSGALQEAADGYRIRYSAFGIIPIKEVQVDVAERQTVTACGIPVGIYIKTQGVLIVGTGEVVDIAGEPQNLNSDLVCSGDYILAVNQVPVTEKEEVVEQINRAVDGQVKLSVLRGEEILELTVPVVQTGESEYKAGIWIRDDTQGIGTLTYVTEDGSFGALGHGISDIDTSTLLTLEGGNLYQTKISSIVRGTDGLPGEVQGTINYQEAGQLGEITKNTELGIFGTLNEKTLDDLEGIELETAYRQEVQTGEAQILSALSGEVRSYEIEIEKVNLNSGDANKGMVIRITDPELLELTGGIIQGMSGSPILQNGRLIGAVTHVFVKDPTKGYGIFIENMLEGA